jgi:hypothetical protein
MEYFLYALEGFWFHLARTLEPYSLLILLLWLPFAAAFVYFGIKFLDRFIRPKHHAPAE